MIPAATLDYPVWLRVGTLLDGVGTTPLRDVHVVYRHDGIRYVGPGDRSPPRELVRAGQTGPDVHAPDATLLPGLIEAHAHLFLEGGELDLQKRAAYLQQTSEQLLAAANERLGKLVRLGIAGVRDAGDKDGVGLALSRLYRSAQRPLMPYLESPGAAIHHRGRYGSFMADPIENHASLRACVESRIAAGADRIKLIPTGIINFKQGAVTTEPQMTTAEVAEIVRAARSAGRQTFAHASGDIGIDRAIEGGVDSIEHGFFMRADQLARLRTLHTAWVPTFAPVQEQIDHADLMGWDAEVIGNLRRILEQHAASLAKAHAMGVLIVAGSDAGSCGVAHGTGFLYELELMERAGMPSVAVINAATGVSAGRLRYQERIGRIEPGYRSRMILTRHSPLTTIANLRKARTVIFDGEVFETGEDADIKNL
ncbi:amidohydrolase family protein [Opitutus terrae]|uniref:Amidohydrolase n=1 Tax=Opitutus terrae (strain DSM 11246 / JCM 15787 / PB90-1) TaxID=452637 RepID=B1ZPB6_OPITP|nr:amidohydrolase family protein [Opitutus terrae]ACB77605.1 amidohydrolase [Opitutus terrae PB90-1]